MIILNILALFFVDLLAFTIFNKPIFSFLFAYFLLFILYNKIVNFKYKILFLVFLFLQDYVFYGASGYCLVYFIFVSLFDVKIKRIFSVESGAFYIVFLSIIILLRLYFIDFLLLHRNIYTHSTLIDIFISILSGSLILLGMRGNRF